MRHLAWLVPVLGFAAAVSAQIGAAGINVERPNDPLYLPDAHIARHLDLGFGEAWADWLHIQALIYVVEEFDDRQTAYTEATTELERQQAVRHTKYRWLAQLYNSMTELDPKFREAYLYGARFLTLLSKEQDEAIALLERGIANVPEPYDLQEELGMIHYIDRKDTASALRWLNLALENPNASPRLIGFVTRISEGTNYDIEVLRSLDSQIAHYAGLGDAPMETALRAKKREHFARIALRRLRDMYDQAIAAGAAKERLTLEALQNACYTDRQVPPGFFAEAGGFWYDPATGDVESRVLAPDERDRRSRRLALLLQGYRAAHGGRLPDDPGAFHAWSTERIPHHPLQGWNWSWDPSTGEVREETP